jgi:hypothetical protein
VMMRSGNWLAAIVSLIAAAAPARVAARPGSDRAAVPRPGFPVRPRFPAAPRGWQLGQRVVGECAGPLDISLCQGGLRALVGSAQRPPAIQIIADPTRRHAHSGVPMRSGS